MKYYCSVNIVFFHWNIIHLCCLQGCQGIWTTAEHETERQTLDTFQTTCNTGDGGYKQTRSPE